MQVHQVPIQVILLSTILGNVLFSFYVGLNKPGWLFPSLALALLSLAVLSVAALAKLEGEWLWAITVYSIVYPFLLILSWRKLTRKRDHEAPLAMIDAPPQAPALSLKSEDGHAVLVHLGDIQRPLCRAGQPVDALLPGWSVSAIHVDLAPVVIVSLRHGDGRAARWIIDAASETYNEPVSQLPRTVRDTLRAGTKRKLQDIRSRDEIAFAAWNAMPRTTRLELLADLETHAGPGGDGLSALMGGGTHDSGQVLPVCSDDDLLSAVLPTGVEIPILRDGTVLRNTDL